MHRKTQIWENQKQTPLNFLLYIQGWIIPIFIHIWPLLAERSAIDEKNENLTESRNLVQALIRLNLSFTLINTFA